jgi:signal transduction histidine kinase
MRWPLRYQILIPMAAVMLLTVASIGGLGAVLALRWTQQRIESQIDEVAQIVAQTNFPLTDAVLRQMRALSGAELVLVDGSGSIVAASGAKEQFDGLFRENSSRDASPEISLGNRRWTKNGDYFDTVLPVAERENSAAHGVLHILYPVDEYRRAWQHAVYPSIGFVVVALPVMLLLAMVTASQISDRVGRLHSHVDRIAGGDFRPMKLPRRADELQALAIAVNCMAERLALYEEEVRRTERMRTLAHLGGGIAHQLRNSATGCLMALDLHEQECIAGEDCESLTVAKQQLHLMETYLQRFLQLGKTSQDSPHIPIDLPALVEDILPLVQPAARHAGVELKWKCRSSSASILGNADRLSQLIVNILVNAVEAAAERKAQTSAPGRAAIVLEQASPDHITLTVSDSGSGPSDHVQANLFTPFVTGKPDGVGLGLSMAQEIAAEHGGSLTWSRTAGMTCFQVELPCHITENCCVHSDGR